MQLIVKRIVQLSMFLLPHTHPFNSPLSGPTWVSRYQKGKTNLDFNEARDIEWQWHQLGHMQVCTLLQTDNHTSIPPFRQVFYRPDALPAAQPTASKHWRHKHHANKHEIKIFYSLWIRKRCRHTLAHNLVKYRPFQILSPADVAVNLQQSNN